MNIEERHQVVPFPSAPAVGAEDKSLGDQAYYRLRDLIITLELAPGRMLTERDLVLAAGYPRSPVRDALRRLAEEKLVEVFPRRGVQIAPVDIRDLGAISEARIEIEGLAARLAAGRANGDERDLALDLASRAGGSGDLVGNQQALMRLDARIHRHIHRASHNLFLEDTLERYFVLSLRVWFLVLDRVPALASAVEEHRQLLTAVAQGDADKAEKVMRLHVAGFEREIRRVL